MDRDVPNILWERDDDGSYIIWDTKTGRRARGNTQDEALKLWVNKYGYEDLKLWVNKCRKTKPKISPHVSRKQISTNSYAWDTFKDEILALASVLSIHIPLSKTTLHKYALILRNVEMFPYFTKNLRPYGIMSCDVEMAIQELITEGSLKIEKSPQKTHQNSAYSSTRTMDVIKVNPVVKVGLPLDFEEKISKMVKRFGSDIRHLGQLSKKHFIDSVSKDENYHYASPRWNINKIRGLKDKPFVIPSKLQKLNGINKYLGKIAYDIIETKESFTGENGFVFSPQSITEAYNDRSFWDNKVLDTECFLVGHLSYISETEDNLYYKFSESYYSETQEIKVIVDKNGVFNAEKIELTNYQYIIIGVIGENEKEPVIKAAALIAFDKIPDKFLDTLN